MNTAEQTAPTPKSKPDCFSATLHIAPADGSEPETADSLCCWIEQSLGDTDFDGVVSILVSPADSEPPAPITSRHDYTDAERFLMNLAVSLKIADAIDLGVLMVTHGTDVKKIFQEISEWVFVNRHDRELYDSQTPWIAACEDMWDAKATAAKAAA